MQPNGRQPGLGGAFRPVGQRQILRHQHDAAGLKGVRRRRQQSRCAPVGESGRNVKVGLRGSGFEGKVETLGVTDGAKLGGGRGALRPRE